MLFIAALWCWSYTGTPALAHKVGCEVFTTAEGTRLQVESWLGGGGSPKGVRVLVSRPDGSLYLEGLTDDEGMFVFTPEGKIPYRVVIEAGLGHRAETVVSADTLAELVLAQTSSAAHPGAGGAAGSAANHTPAKQAPAPATQATSSASSAEPADKANAPTASGLRSTQQVAKAAPQPRRNSYGSGLKTREAVVLGLAFILALAAVLMAYGNRSRLKRIERQLNGRDSI